MFAAEKVELWSAGCSFSGRIDVDEEGFSLELWTNKGDNGYVGIVSARSGPLAICKAILKLAELP